MNQRRGTPASKRPPAARSEGIRRDRPTRLWPVAARSSKLDRIFTRSLIFSAHLPVRSVQVARRCGLAAS